MAVSEHGEHVPWHRREDLKPAVGHGFWWFMFGNGGAIAAILLPVTILVVGVLGPLGVSNWMEDSAHFAWTLANPLIKLFFVVLCGFTFVHSAHRLQAMLFDFGIRDSTVLVQRACYGLAILATVAAAVLLIITP